MDVFLPADFHSIRPTHRTARDDLNPGLGADAYVHLDRSAFVTGLRDWRSTPDTSARHPAPAAESERQPL